LDEKSLASGLLYYPFGWKIIRRFEEKNLLDEKSLAYFRGISL
jgi:hypothetical protein